MADQDTKAQDTRANVEKPGFQQGSAKPGDEANPDNRQEPLNERLDEALEETFPSSDPVSVKITK